MTGDKFKLLAGPCVIESEENVLMLASALKDIASKHDVDFYFKASWDKANRTKATNYRGPGMEEGLRILKKAKDEVGVKIVTDIHEPYQAQPVSQVADIIQIPAFLCRQTDLLKAAAETGKTINIKKAQFSSPEEMGNVVSNQSKPNTYGGYMVRLEFTKNDSVTVLSDHNYSLYWVSRPPDNGYFQCVTLLPWQYTSCL